MDARIQKTVKAVRAELVAVYREVQEHSPLLLEGKANMQWASALQTRLERLAVDLQRAGVGLPVPPMVKDGVQLISPLQLPVNTALTGWQGRLVNAWVFGWVQWSHSVRRMVEDLDGLLRIEPEHVDTDYSEAYTKAEWRKMLNVSEKTFGRQIQGACPQYRLFPGTNPRAKRIRIHIDDLPSNLKTAKQRRDAAEKLNRQ
jgi:hypothetical protein